MIWKDRVKQYAHRFRLTNVSGSTYDFEEVTGEVIQRGTPLNAENMNKLALKTSIEGLKPHAFNNLATAQGTQTDVAPSNKLLQDSSYSAVYKYLSDIGLGNESTQVDIINAMSDNSVMLADFSSNIYKPSGLTLCTIFVMKTSVDRNTLCVYDKDTGQMYLGAVGTVGGVQSFSGWKKTLVDTDISTVMPISSGAASNAKVVGEKLFYDQMQLKRTTYTSLASVNPSLEPSTVTPYQLANAMETNSTLNIPMSRNTCPALLPSTAPGNGGMLQVIKGDVNSVSFEYTIKPASANDGVQKWVGFCRPSNATWSGWRELDTADTAPIYVGSTSTPYVVSSIPYPDGTFVTCYQYPNTQTYRWKGAFHIEGSKESSFDILPKDFLFDIAQDLGIYNGNYWDFNFTTWEARAEIISGGAYDAANSYMAVTRQRTGGIEVGRYYNISGTYGAWNMKDLENKVVLFDFDIEIK